MARVLPKFHALSPVWRMETTSLQWAAAHHAGDRKALADKLGISERTLHRKLAT
jgi:DNA-binding NtrC family response regulator